MSNRFDGISWVVLGSCTGTRQAMEALIKKYPDLTLIPFGKKFTAQPRIEWVQEIVEAADKAGIPVFLKDNLEPLVNINLSCAAGLITSDYVLRQEMPE